MHNDRLLGGIVKDGERDRCQWHRHRRTPPLGIKVPLGGSDVDGGADGFDDHPDAYEW